MGQQQANAVGQAVAAWAKAPMHVKTMAGAYVGPLLVALQQLEARVSAAERGVNALCMEVTGVPMAPES